MAPWGRRRLKRAIGGGFRRASDLGRRLIDSHTFLVPYFLGAADSNWCPIGSNPAEFHAVRQPNNSPPRRSALPAVATGATEVVVVKPLALAECTFSDHSHSA